MSWVGGEAEHDVGVTAPILGLPGREQGPQHGGPAPHGRRHIGTDASAPKPQTARDPPATECPTCTATPSARTVRPAQPVATRRVGAVSRSLGQGQQRGGDRGEPSVAVGFERAQPAQIPVEPLETKCGQGQRGWR